MTKKKIEQRTIEIISIIQSKLGIKILKIDDEKNRGRYFCWGRYSTNIKGSNDVCCVIIECEEDEKVIKFCEKNELMNTWPPLPEKGLFITASLNIKDGKSLLEIIKIVKGDI